MQENLINLIKKNKHKETCKKVFLYCLEAETGVLEIGNLS